MTKQAIINALRAFINQRSGIDFRNYWTGDYWNARSEARQAFMGDYRPILRHGRHARLMLRQVELRDSITAEDLLQAARSAYAGRLQFQERPNGGVAVEYTTGQYFPTEYRNAACAVLASVFWHYWQPDCKDCAEIRRKAKAEFGPAIARTWFN